MIISEMLNSQEKIKICYLIDSLSGGGAEKQLIQLVRNLNTDRFEPTVCCLSAETKFSKQSDYISPYIEVFKMDNLFSIVGLKEFIRFISLLRRENFHLIHSWLFTSDIVGLIGGAIARVRSRISSRRDTGFWKKYHHRLFYNFILNRLTSHFITNAAESKSRLMIEENVSEKRITMIVNGVDLDKFKPRSKQKESPNFPVMGIVASLTEVKGHVYLFEAFKKLLKSYPFAILKIAGTGPLEGELKKYSKTLGIRDHILFHGYVNNIVSLYNSVDLLISSSLSEATSNSILEGMACGLHVIATKVGDNSKIIKQGETGYLCEPAESNDLYEKMLRSTQDLEAGMLHAKRSRDFIRDNYSMAKMVDQTENIYLKELNRNLS